MPSTWGLGVSTDRAATEARIPPLVLAARSLQLHARSELCAIVSAFLPPAFVAFLYSVGIDPMKGGRGVPLGPERPRCHQVRRVVSFIGDLQKTGDFRD